MTVIPICDNLFARKGTNMNLEIKLPGKLQVASHIVDRPISNAPLVVENKNAGTTSLFVQSLKWDQRGDDWFLIIEGVLAGTGCQFSAEVNGQDGEGTLKVGE